MRKLPLIISFLWSLCFIDLFAQCTAPTLQASGISISTPTSTSMNISWTRGNGNNVIVIAKEGIAPTDPSNGTAYTANNAYGSGSVVGGGYAVYNGAGTSVTVSELTAGSIYHFAIYEYNSTGNCYNLAELSGSAKHFNTMPNQTIQVERNSRTYSISGFVFLDNAGDGQSTSDVGINAVTVQLYLSGGILVSSASSNASGNFTFSNVLSGRIYYIKATLPSSSYAFTFPDIGSDATDSDISETNGAGTSANITISGANVNIDIGIYQCAKVVGMVYSDVNSSNTYEKSSDGQYSGVGCKIYRNHFGVWTYWTIVTSYLMPFSTLSALGYTGPYIYYGGSCCNGFFAFTCLPPGEYYVEGAILAKAFVNSNVGTNEWVDSDIDGSYTNASSGAFFIPSGGLKQDLTIGYRNATSSNPAISSLTCASASFSPVTINSGAPYIGTLTIPYTGGNAVPYGRSHPLPSSGVTGLLATLRAGTLASGSGSLIYDITGVPSGTGTATFNLGFWGVNCTINKAVSAGAVVGSLNCASATFSPSTITKGSAYTGTLTVPYTGGNGYTYGAGSLIPSNGVEGLNAQLNAGTLAVGSGNITYSVTGTATTAGDANFSLAFGGQLCSITKTIVPPPTCSMTLEMYDSFGDGWTGFNLRIKHNGTTLGDYTLTSGSFSSTTISYPSSGTISIEVTALGLDPTDVHYIIYNNSGLRWFTKFPIHSIGTVYSANMPCP